MLFSIASFQLKPKYVIIGPICAGENRGKVAFGFVSASLRKKRVHSVMVTTLLTSSWAQQTKSQSKQALLTVVQLVYTTKDSVNFLSENL